MIQYKGFEIEPGAVLIFKDGRRVFTAHWQMVDTVEEAKLQIDQSLAEKERIMKARPNLSAAGSNLLKDFCSDDDHREEDEERFRSWTENEAEKQLHDDQY